MQIEQTAQELRDYMLKNGIKRCLCCEASMRKSTHHMTRVLVESLVKMARSVARSQQNDVMIDKMDVELRLTHVERCNFHKLRMHGLVARVKQEGKIKRGRWLITRRGWQFIKGDIDVPEFVQSFRNKVVGKSANMITVSGVLGLMPYCEDINDQFFDFVDEEDLGVVVEHYTGKKKRRKNGCPACTTGKLTAKLNVTFNDKFAPGAELKVTGKTWSCDTCTYTRVEE